MDRLLGLIPRRIGSEPITPIKEIPAQVTSGVAARLVDWPYADGTYPDSNETAIGHVYGEPEPPKPPGTPGRRPVLPPRQAPPDLTYATVHKERAKGRVVAITLAVVLGTWQAVAAALKRSGASRTINTSFVERHHLTDRHHNARKSRKTYRFSKDWRMHEAMTYFTMYSYNFCWPVRTLRERPGRCVAEADPRDVGRAGGSCLVTCGMVDVPGRSAALGHDHSFERPRRIRVGARVA